MRAAVGSLDSSRRAPRRSRDAGKPALLVLLAHRRGFRAGVVSKVHAETRHQVAAGRAVLRARLPRLIGPARDDICYATSDRQQAIVALAPRADAFFVIGGRASADARRLAGGAAAAAGCARLTWIERPEELAVGWLDGVRTLGIGGGAATPEASVQRLLARLRLAHRLAVEEDGDGDEEVRFTAPMVDARPSANRERLRGSPAPLG